MPKLLLTPALVLTMLLSGGSAADAKVQRATVANGCPGLVKGVYYYRNKAHHWEHKLNKSYTKSSFNASLIRSCRYTKWVAHRWMKRAYKGRIMYVAWLRKQRVATDPRTAICSVFGSHCQEALAVAECEGGLSPNAHNGQYLGTFQMGSHERAIYGHGSTILEQAKAAYRYFRVAGWSPWTCQPY